jgi:hypothetical protein
VLRDPSVKSSIQTQAVWTDVLYIGSGVFGATAVVLAFTTRWRSETPASRDNAAWLAPWFSPEGAGLAAAGRF